MPVWVQIFITMSAIITAICTPIAAIVGIINKGKVQNLHLLVNSRMTQLIESVTKTSRAEGVVQGIKEGVVQGTKVANAVNDAKNGK